MLPAEQVTFVLQVVLALGPLSVYFLALGLVNSQARPCLVDTRSDFLLLVTALVPALAGPVGLLALHGRPALAIGGLIGAAAVLARAVPARGSGWVIYNVAPACARRLLERACRRSGWGVTGGEDRLSVIGADLELLLSALPWLRNVTVSLRSSDPDAAGPARTRLAEAIRDEIRAEAALPSPTGASLVVVGTALLGVPTWYLLHHMDAIVEVVRSILVA